MRFSIAFLFLCTLAPVTQAQSKSPKDVTETICTACHGLEVADGRSMSRQDWAAVIEDMARKGADGTKDELELVASYLATQYGPEINVNRASAKDLQGLFDITTKQAEAIVTYRTQKGNFKDLADLTKVPDVPTAKIEQMKAKIKF